MIGAWIPLLLVLLLAVGANGFVFFIILKSKLIYSRQNVIVVLLVISDFLRCFIKFLELAILFDNDAMENMVHCESLGFFLVVSDTMGCLAVTSLFYDRLMFISGPINYRHRITGRLVLIIIIYVCFHGFVLAILPVAGWGGYVYYASVGQCGIKLPNGLGFGVFQIIWGCCIPMCASIVIFARIVFLVRRKVNRIKVYGTLKSTLQPMGIHKCVNQGCITELDMAFIKTMRILTFMLAFYCVSWLSFILTIVYTLPLNGERLSLAYVAIFTFLSYVTSVANPFLYGFHNRRFRRTVKKIITCGRVFKSDIEELSVFPDRRLSLLASNKYKLQTRGTYVKSDGTNTEDDNTDQLYFVIKPAWKQPDEEYRL